MLCDLWGDLVGCGSCDTRVEAEERDSGLYG